MKRADSRNWVDHYDTEHQNPEDILTQGQLDMSVYRAETHSGDLNFPNNYFLLLMKLDFKYSIFPKNQILTSIKTRFSIEELQTFETSFATEFLTGIKELYLATFKGDFDWGLYEEKIATLERHMKNFFFDAYEQYSIFLYSEGIHEILPLDILAALLNIPYNRYGYKLYDSISRMKSVMLSTFLTQHLGADTKFFVKLEAKNLKNMSTLLRTHIRQTNRRDKLVLAKYLNAKFDIRKFASNMLELYIPNISWRYIGGEVYQPYWAIKMIRMIFELGLYTVADLPELLTQLTNKLENILKLEMAIKNDVKAGKLSIYPDYLACLAIMIVLIRKEVATICLHATILYNDFGLEESVPWGPKFNFPSDFQDCFERTIFNQPTLSGIIYTIMSRFLIMEDTYDSFWVEDRPGHAYVKYTREYLDKVIQERKHFDEIFRELFMMFSKKNDDLFSKSNQTLSELQMNVMLSRDEESKALMEQALVIKFALEELFLQHKIVDYSESKPVLNIVGKSARVYKKILSLITEKVSKGPGVASQFCAYLALQNTHKILLCCLVMQIELLDSVRRNPNHECLNLGVEILSTVCQNELGQIIFFTDSNWELIDHFSKLRPVFFAILIDKVFSSSKELFYRQEVLFNNFMRIYESLIDKVEENLIALTGTLDVDGKMKLDIDCMTNIEMPVKSYISLIVFNNTLKNLIVVQGDPKSRNYHKNLDLVVQRALCHLVNRFLLPKIFAKGQIIMNELNQPRTKKFSKFSDSQIMGSYASKMLLYDEETRAVILNMGWSTIELFTKCTSRLYYDYIRCQTVANLDSSKFEEDYEYLLMFEDGLSFMSILVNLYANFNIFPSNHCISDSRIEVSLTQPNTCFIDSALEGDFKSEDVTKTLILAMERVKNWNTANTAANSEQSVVSLDPNPTKPAGTHNPSQAEQVKAYMLESILPALYKYLKGLVCLVTVSHAETSKSKLLVTHILSQFKELEQKFWDFEAYTKREFGLVFKRNEIDGLLSILKFGQPQLGQKSRSDNKSQNSPTVPKELGGLNLGGLFAAETDPLKASVSNNPTPEELDLAGLLAQNMEMDSDEMQSEDLYHLRSIAKRMTRTIEETLSPHHEEYIESFDRLNALKRKKSKLDELFMKNAASKPTRMTTAEKVTKRLRLESIIQGREPATHLQQFKAVCEVYELKKSEWLLDSGLNNSFFLYMWSQKEAVQVFLKYLVKIFNPESKDSRKIEAKYDGKLHLDLEQYYGFPGFRPSVACLTVAMMLEDEQPSVVLSFLDSIFANVPGTKSTFFKTFESQNANKDSILTTFDFMWVMTRFLFFKTFHDTSYEVLMQVNQTMVDLIKSFSEGTNTHLRRLIRDEKLQVNQFVDPAQQTVLLSFNSQIDRMLEFTEMSFLKYDSYLTMIERPENYTIMINNLRIMIEMIAGPDTRSQDLVHETSLNKMILVLDRMVDDLNSPFYKFKLTVVEYLNCLSQELLVTSDGVFSGTQDTDAFNEPRAKVRITENVANNIRMGMIESLILRLMKKLYIHTHSKSKPWFKAKPIEKLKQDFERQKQDLLKKLGETNTVQLNSLQNNSRSKRLDLYQIQDDNKLRYLEQLARINQKISKLTTFEETYSAFEDKDSVILEEMESDMKIRSHHELLELYCKDPEFSNSNVIKICAELIKLSFNLSKSAEYFKNSMNERSKTLYSYYGAAVPLTILENIDLSGVPDRLGEEPPEDMKVFMFLALLVCQIEIAIPTTTEDGSVYQTKVIMFQLPPQCFMLSPETKNSFIAQMNTDEAVSELQSFQQKFEIEMTSNLATLRRSSFLHKISLHDTLSLLKKILWYLGLFQNLLLLFAARKTSDDNQTVEYFIFRKEVFTWSGVAIAGYTLAVLAIWGYGRYAQNIALAKEDFFRGKKRKRTTFTEKIQIYVIKAFLRKATGVQLLWHLVFSLLGIFVNPFFYTLQLLTLVLISSTASYVVRSITTHIRKLAITFLLAVFVMFSFAYLVYRYYNKDWDGLVDNNGRIQMCQDLWECLFYSVDFGLRNDGGLSDSFGTAVAQGRPGLFISKFIFDMSFFILVSLVLKNVAFGIIIDTFASMRDTITQREAYLNSTCVICKRSKELLAKNDENFFNHIASKHDIWMYVFYRIYLSTKDKDDFNGIEAVIHGYILEDSTDWIPTNKITERKTVLEKISSQIEKHKLDFGKGCRNAEYLFKTARNKIKDLNPMLPAMYL